MVFIDLVLFIAFAADYSEDESELYRAIKMGDEKAFKKFFDAHYDALYVFLRNRNMSREVAEDLIQKAFLYIWEHRKRIKPDLSLKSYLYRIAYTRMLNYVKQNPNHADLENHEIDTTKTPHDTAEYNDLHSAFMKAVSNMPERRRAVFESCFIEDLTYKETAKLLSISVKTVENHMALAFKDLRKELKIFKKI
ncbi:MAG: RNA polymerase sigma-70 factor [Balneolaceae bacterium]|nr:RNA polymerase sigma-70 factor [Balneolaceae bacterium]